VADHPCAYCGHDGPTHLRTVDAPTAALRETARQVGIGAMRLWLCDDAQACVRRITERGGWSRQRPGPRFDER